MPSRRRANRLALSACLASTALFAGCNARQAALLDGEPALERRGTPDAAAAAGFVVDCPAGESWVARLDQQAFDARLELVDSRGERRVAVAGPARGGGHEFLFAAGSTDAPQRLRVVAERPAPASARFVLQVHCLRSPPAAAVAALRAMNAAADPSRTTEEARRDAAVADYEAAAATWTRLGETALAAEAALQLAALHYYEREAWAPAIAAARRALAAAGPDGARSLRAAARLLEGAALLEEARAGRVTGTAPTAGADAVAPPAGPAADRWEEARAALREAAQLYRDDALPIEAAEVDVYRAGLDYERGELDAAVAGFEAAGAALRAAGADESAAQVTRNLAAVRFDRGDYRGALRDYEALLARLPPTPSDVRASVLQNLAAAAAATGQAERALAAYRESLDIGTALGDLDVTARALAGLGVNHGRLGHQDLALTYLRDAVAQRRRQGRPDALAQALALLGNAQLQAGEPRLAGASHREAIALLGPGAAPTLRARIELALAQDQLAARDHARAIETASAALARLPGQRHFIAARLLVVRAAASRASGALPAAAADVAEALARAQEANDRETVVAARVEAARLALARGERALALREAGIAVREIERLPVGATNPENRQTLRARLRGAFDLRVQLLASEAMTAAGRGERDLARRRALEALRASAGAGLPGHAAAHGGGAASGGDGDADGPDTDIYAQLAARRERYEALAERHTRPTPTMLGLEREIALLRTRLATGDVAASDAFDDATPPPGAGAQPGAGLARDGAARGAPDSVPALPPDVAVLAYWLGEERSWLWTLTRDRVELHPLPARARLEAAVAQLLRTVRRPDADAAATAPMLDALQRLLLPASAVPDAGRWRIVPEGALGALPWALLAPRDRVESVALLTSAGALFQPGRAPARAGTRDGDARAPRLALFGDPVFEADDPRLAARVEPASAPQRPAAEPEPRRLARLPGTAREVAAIARIAGDGVRVQATGLEATRDAVLRLPAGSLDVLHLATHAVIDASVPELAAIVLSRVDARGTPRPARLRPHDIMRLPGVPPLVVLSACDAAAEPGGAAEGRMNLAGAFLVAGAADVIGSLWEASDAATTELMTRFYDGLLRQRLDPEAALARAQRELAADPRWRAPFYWAGFVLTRAAP